MSKTSLMNAIKQIVNSGIYTDSTEKGGLWVQKFESKLTSYLGKETVVVNSGTSALIMSLRMAGVKAGDEVIIPAYGFIATKNAVLALQAKPVYVDINQVDFTPNWYTIGDKINQKTKAIIIVDLYGNIADLPVIGHVPVIEDACQALGTIKRIRADYTCFSFYPTKIVGAMEGGAIVCDSTNKVRRLRTYSKGLNLRMGEINACIGYHNMIGFTGGRPKGYKKHYNYTLSPLGECPNADLIARTHL